VSLTDHFKWRFIVIFSTSSSTSSSNSRLKGIWYSKVIVKMKSDKRFVIYDYLASLCKKQRRHRISYFDLLCLRSSIYFKVNRVDKSNRRAKYLMLWLLIYTEKSLPQQFFNGLLYDSSEHVMKIEQVCTDYTYMVH